MSKVESTVLSVLRHQAISRMAAAADGVEISPNDLRFRFQLNKQLLGNISINNTSDKRIGFKIKTTAPKKYVVRPSSGIADSKSSISVQVIMQAQKDYPTDFQSCKDKFMVQTVPVGEGEELDKDTFNKDVQKDSLKEARLRVILEGPAAPPSPVPEASEQDEESSRAADRGPAPKLAEQLSDATDTAHQETAALKSKLDKVTLERDDLRRALDQMQLKGSRTTTASRKGFQLSILHVILVAIIAFLLGHYT